MISIKNMRVGYAKNKCIFDGVDLELSDGNVYGLFGRNGSGKTTLLKIILGILHPQVGDISVFGYSPYKRNKNYLKDVIYMPDDIDLPTLSFDKFVEAYSKFYENFSREQFDEYVSAFGIDKNVVMSKQSFGEKKKLFISFILACNTRLLIMDEPTNGLDTVSKKIFKKIMLSVIDDNKIIIISTHHTADLKNIISGIIVLKDKGLLSGTLDDISDKLYFGNIADQQEPIYAEGLCGIYKNEYGADSEINLELLVNSICLNDSIVKIIKGCNDETV